MCFRIALYFEPLIKVKEYQIKWWIMASDYIMQIFFLYKQIEIHNLKSKNRKSQNPPPKEKKIHLWKPLYILPHSFTKRISFSLDAQSKPHQIKSSFMFEQRKNSVNLIPCRRHRMQAVNLTSTKVPFWVSLALILFIDYWNRRNQTKNLLFSVCDMIIWKTAPKWGFCFCFFLLMNDYSVLLLATRLL